MTTMNDNMQLIILKRNELESSKTNTTNSQAIVENQGLLNSGNRPGQKHKISWGEFSINLVRCIVPPWLIYLSLKYHNNSVISMLEMCVLYILVLGAHFFIVDSNLFKALYISDIMHNISKLNMVFYLPMCASATVLFIIGFIYCKFIPFGPKKVTIYLSDTGIIMRFIQWVFFIAIHTVVLPVLETLYYFFLVFSKYHYNIKLRILLSVLYGLMHFCWIVLVFERFGWVLFITVVMGFFGWILLVAVLKETFFKALSMRVGVGIGTVLLLIWLDLCFDNKFAAPDNITFHV